MKLPGIGPKVARLIVLVAWGAADGIIVDTHVHRIARRLGWTTAEAKSPEDTRRELEEWIPRDKWGDISKLLIGFGQTHCPAVKPKCGTCPLRASCPSASL
ncbi:endonuclease III, HhH-GPD superfamily base excision DNA repair [Achlya hypogyna]|uniref:Endonuclease III, HhH-GPD superfamily base excision DNA repair n=1 Tax=Achlya hypogyna TaxID=1202772 RepID=A0A1V9ZJG3_ACHHY|nr:endonuclease III, HhH-GPD superfamily base excision DNA repair [Achlya hypogyna]